MWYNRKSKWAGRDEASLVAAIFTVPCDGNGRPVKLYVGILADMQATPTTATCFMTSVPVAVETGGKTAATLYTLVQSARRNCVDVWPYMTDVLRRVAAIAPDDTAALEALLPDR